MSNKSFIELTEQSDAVLRGTVTRYHRAGDDRSQPRIALAMTIEIDELYKGSIHRRSVKVWGDNGAQCRPYVTRFPIGSEWVLALSRAPEENGDDFMISGCGEYWLSVKGDSIQGKNIDGGNHIELQKISIPMFRKLLGVEVESAIQTNREESRSGWLERIKQFWVMLTSKFGEIIKE